MTELLSRFIVARKPSRKIKAFLWMVSSIIALVWVATTIHAPENVVIQALWVIAAGGLFTIGGQSLVDSIGKWRKE
jgi:hypothetical protein